MRKAVIIAVLSVLALPAAAAIPLPSGEQWQPDLGYLPDYGDLVKLVNDHDPATTSDEAVYYIDADQKRRAFPNRRVYESWYRDFSSVKEITAEEMARIRLGPNVRYRPGTRLIKIPTVPKVYALEPGGVLRWVASESVAVRLYGADWAKRVDDVPETFFLDYREGVPITAARWPTGTILRRVSDTAIFYVDGDQKRYIRPDALSALRLSAADTIDVDGDLSDYGDGAQYAGPDIRITDTGETFRTETEPPPAFDFPEIDDEVVVVAGADATLYAFRLTTGDEAVFRGIAFELSGVLASGNAVLTDLRVEDEEGNRIFGTVELSGSGDAERVGFTGADGLPADSQRTYRLVARVAADAPAGTVVRVRGDRSSLNVADSRGTLDRVWPLEEWPEREIEVE